MWRVTVLKNHLALLKPINFLSTMTNISPDNFDLSLRVKHIDFLGNCEHISMLTLFLYKLLSVKIEQFNKFGAANKLNSIYRTYLDGISKLLV